MISVDYITAEQASAVRAVHDGLANWHNDHRDMTIIVGSVKIPVDIAKRYMEDWRKSGLWSLPTIEDIQAKAGFVAHATKNPSHGDS